MMVRTGKNKNDHGGSYLREVRMTMIIPVIRRNRNDQE